MRAIPFIALPLSLLLQACTSAPQVAVTAPLTNEELAWSVKEGTNTVKGNLTFKAADGTVRTCHSFGAFIRPDTAYARERIQYLYGNLERGYRPLSVVPKFEPSTPLYMETTRHVPCDANGNFIFTKLPSGTWFLTAPLYEGEIGNGVYEGEYLMQKVTLTGGKTYQVRLTE